MSSPFARFVLVGVGGYAVNVVGFAALYGLGAPYAAAAAVAYLGSNASMYLANRFFTFRLARDGIWSSYGRYVLVGIVVAVLRVALLAAQVEALGADARLGQAVALAAVTPLAFVLNRRWTFRLQPA